jgi:hypothetical protein
MTEVRLSELAAAGWKCYNKGTQERKSGKSI